jgi:hypothetical protein
MLIIGCDFHTRYQQIAMTDGATGELIGRRLDHENREANRSTPTCRTRFGWVSRRQDVSTESSAFRANWATAWARAEDSLALGL